MRYIITMLLALTGAIAVVALTIALLKDAHPYLAGVAYFGGFYVLNKAFRKYTQP